MGDAEQREGRAGKPDSDRIRSRFSLAAPCRANEWGSGDFSVYAEGKARKRRYWPRSGNILYLPLPDALYAVDTVGHYAWMLSPWESSDGKTSKLINPRTFLACTADEQAFMLFLGTRRAITNWRP